MLINPKNKFQNSKIKTITGNIVLIGDASEMFENARNFVGDVTWNTSQVTNMSHMFSRAISFKGDIKIGTQVK